MSIHTKVRTYNLEQVLEPITRGMFMVPLWYESSAIKPKQQEVVRIGRQELSGMRAGDEDLLRYLDRGSQMGVLSFSLPPEYS